MTDSQSNPYDTHAERLAAQYNSIPSILEGWFDRLCLQNGPYLDIGCGSGRDLHYLVSRKFNAYGVEASEQMVAEAYKAFPDLEDRILIGDFPECLADPGLPESWPGYRQWAAVGLSAVIQHIPFSLLPSFFTGIAQFLRDGGKLRMVYPLKHRGHSSDFIDDIGRSYYIRDPDEYARLLEPMGFYLEYRDEGDDRINRKNTHWRAELWKYQI